MPRSTTLLARGPTAKEALRALFLDLAEYLPSGDDPGTVVVVQARAEHDGSGYVAEAAVWHVARRHPEVESG